MKPGTNMKYYRRFARKGAVTLLVSFSELWPFVFFRVGGTLLVTMFQYFLF